MVAYFCKEVLAPGERNGIKITADDCRQLFDSVSRVHDAGLYQPLILEHAPIDRESDSEGWPIQFSAADETWQKKAAKLRATIGTVVKDHPGNRINERGGVDLVFAVPDEAEAAKFRDGRYRFVSPEIRPDFKNLGPAMTHFAVTHRPFQRWQNDGFLQLSEAIQLGDASQNVTFTEVEAMPIKKPVQFADDKPGEAAPPAPAAQPQSPPAPAPAAEPENPDMPKQKADAQKLEALVAQLSAMNLVMPADTDETNLIDRLLAACMTKNAVEAANKSKGGDNDGDDGGRVAGEESMGGIQFSDGSPQAKLVAKIKAAKALPFKIRKSLLAKVKTLQFSDDGEEATAEGSLSVGEILSAYEGLPDSDADPMQEGQDSILDRIQKLLDEGKITEAVANLLRSKVGAVQFSDSGELSGDAVVLVKHFEASPKLPPIMLDLTKSQWLQLSDENKSVDAGEIILQGDPRAKAEADRILAQQKR